jgi:pimeloyl-ACP methyl ester carboxylesterase
MTTATSVAPQEDARTAHYREAERAVWAHYGLSPTERLVHAGSPPARIRVVEVGSGRPLFVAHGTFGNGPAFAPLVRELPDRRWLIVDRPGWGFSSPLDYKAETFARTIADLQRDVLDSLGIDQVDAVGHSIGAVFTLRLAQLHPERIRRVVLLGAGPLVAEAHPPPPIRLMASPVGRVMLAMIKQRRITEQMVRGSGHGPSIDDGRIPGVLIDWRTAVNRDTDSMRYERAMVRALLGPDGWRPGLTLSDADLAGIRHETRMLYGTRDSVGSPTIWRRMTDTMPHARLSIHEGAGHMLWLDDPTRVAAELREFLGG